MSNALLKLQRDERRLRLMTHVVAGYPDQVTCAALLESLAGNGSDLIEIQIPFSDPLADGPVIMAANQVALDQGITPQDSLELAASFCRKHHTPVLLVTYANIAFRMGLAELCQRSASAGVQGLIIPDLPFDEPSEPFWPMAKRYGLVPIMLVSPGMEQGRLAAAMVQAQGFVYTTLKVGTTGTEKSFAGSGLEFLSVLRQATTLPLAAGFGISAPEQLVSLRGLADIAVIGSRLLEIFNSGGLTAVSEFLQRCRVVTA